MATKAFCHRQDEAQPKILSKLETGDIQLSISTKQYEEIMHWIPLCKSKFELEVMGSLLCPRLPEETFYSLYSHYIVQQTKSTIAMHAPKKSEYYRKFCGILKKKQHNGIITSMAEKYQVTPCTMARLIVDEYLSEKNPKLIGFSPGTSKSEVIAEIFDDPVKCGCPDLAAELSRCEMDDVIFGPMADTIKRTIGHTYEIKLKDWCKKHQLKFKTEERLRHDGFDKTPDIKFHGPVVDHETGFTFNWIESKAMFGDAATHKEYMEKQLIPYTARYGPGLVIYWFGFIAELNRSAQDGILLVHRLPAQVTLVHSPHKGRSVRTQQSGSTFDTASPGKALTPVYYWS